MVLTLKYHYVLENGCNETYKVDFSPYFCVCSAVNKTFSLYILPLINGALVSTAETKYAECAVESENNVHTRNGSMLL